MMKQKARSTQATWSARAARILGSAGAAVVAGSVVAGSVAAVPDAAAQEATPGEAPSKASCAQAYESSQESRAAGQLQETQKRLSVCARPECPSFVQKDCARWLEEVDRELPSVTLHAEGLDAEAAGQVRVTLDGQPIPNAFGGGPIALDPGRHELVAESPGRSPIARTVVAQQGVQNRSISLDFAPEPAPAASAEVSADAGSPGSSLRPYAYVAWGLGAVGLGTFAVLGTLGRADERALKDDCPSATEIPELEGPGVCAASEADERKQIYEREFVLADIGLVTGIMGAAAGTVLFILAATDGSSDADAPSSDAGLHLDVTPAPGGGYASVGGVF